MSDIREDLKAYVDGELGVERAAEVEAALESDPSLREEVEAYRAIGEGIRELALAPPVEGYERTVQRLSQGRGSWLHRVAPWVAAVGLTAIVGAIIFPVFAQSKASAKKTSALSEAKQAALAREIAGEDKTRFRNGRVEGSDSADAAAYGADAEEAYAQGGVTDIVDFAKNGAAASTVPDAQGGATAAKVAESSPGPERPSLPAEPVATRLVIQQGEISVRVDDALEARAKTEAMAKGLGGFVASTSGSSYQSGTPVANLTIRVPSKSYEVAMDRIRKIEEGAEVLSDSSYGEDVTTQVADAEARLRVLRGEEEQYLSILKATSKIGDVLAVKERLSMVRQQIESYDAQRKALRDQAALSTIHATFAQRDKVREAEENRNWAGDAWVAAVNGLKAVGTALAQVAIFLFVFSPIWLPIALLVWWLARRAR